MLRISQKEVDRAKGFLYLPFRGSIMCSSIRENVTIPSEILSG